MKSRGPHPAPSNLDDKHVSRGYVETVDMMFVRTFQSMTNQMEKFTLLLGSIQSLIHGCWENAGIRSCSSYLI